MYLHSFFAIPFRSSMIIRVGSSLPSPPLQSAAIQAFRRTEATTFHVDYSHQTTSTTIEGSLAMLIRYHYSFLSVVEGCRRAVVAVFVARIWALKVILTSEVFQ